MVGVLFQVEVVFPAIFSKPSWALRAVISPKRPVVSLILDPIHANMKSNMTWVETSTASEDESHETSWGCADSLRRSISVLKSSRMSSMSYAKFLTEELHEYREVGSPKF